MDFTFFRCNDMKRIEDHKNDLMTYIYNTLYKDRIRNTTYFQVLEYIDNCFFYIQYRDVLWEYKKYLFFKSYLINFVNFFPIQQKKIINTALK